MNDYDEDDDEDDVMMSTLVDKSQLTMMMLMNDVAWLEVNVNDRVISLMLQLLQVIKVKVWHRILSTSISSQLNEMLVI